MTSKKKTFFAIGIAVFLIGLFILLNTYAFWRLKGEQSDSNYVVGACLSFEFVETPDPDHEGETIGGFDLTDTWPISDEEGIATTGYTFKIKNNCAEDVNYQVVLESLKTQNENYFDNDYIKLQLDNKGINRYSALDNVDNDTTDNHPENIRETKEVYAGVIPGTDKDTENNIKSEVTHTIRIWVSSDAENDQIGKEFKSRIKVFAGQGVPEPDIAVTPEECFTFDASTGTITGYDYQTCGTESLVIPATIGGVMVKKISFDQNGSVVQQNWGYLDLSKATGLEYIDRYSFLRYVGTGYDLVIPDNVSFIGQQAFQDFNGSKIIFGDKLNEIGLSAFYYYKGEDENGVKQELVIPDSVTEIGAAAFLCFDGSNLILSNNLNVVKYSTFNHYVGNGPLIIPDSVQSVGNNAFALFNGSDLILGSGLKEIGYGAFSAYTGNPFTIPSNITSIGQAAFGYYSGVININMSETDFNDPNKVTLISGWRSTVNTTLNYLVN